MRSGTGPIEAEKQRAAKAAAALVEDGMTVGLGTGTTVAHLLPELASRGLSIRCVASSPATEQAAADLGLDVVPFGLDRLDIAIDGADQVSPAGWLVKGGGGAHTREKLIAAAADLFVVIVDQTKLVSELHAPVPVELLSFGLESTMSRLKTVRLRGIPLSPDGGVIADFTGNVGSPEKLCALLESTPGVVEHGLFPPQIVSVVLVGRDEEVERMDIGR